jgi:type II secretory pathway component PulK
MSRLLSYSGRGRGEYGVALLLVVFVIAVGTLLVFELARLSRYDQRSSRAFAEGIQANYVIRSGISLAQVMLAIPKPEGQREDWLGDLWAQVGFARELPVEGLPGEPRIQIVDETGKLNLNWLGGKGAQSDKWRERFLLLFNQLGFIQENFGLNENRTVGGAALDDMTQIAAFADWIDEDDISFSSPSLSARGFESGAPPGYFFNRELRTLGEVLLVPGMTRERVSRLLPFVRASEITGDLPRVNVNTARYETLVALGYPETTASEIILNQRREAITQERLKELNAIDESLNQITTTRSKEFSVTVRIRMPNSVRWGRAYISTGSSGGTAIRTTSVRAVEIY